MRSSVKATMNFGVCNPFLGGREMGARLWGLLKPFSIRTRQKERKNSMLGSKLENL